MAMGSTLRLAAWTTSERETEVAFEQGAQTFGAIGIKEGAGLDGIPVFGGLESGDGENVRANARHAGSSARMATVATTSQQSCPLPAPTSQTSNVRGRPAAIHARRAAAATISPKSGDRAVGNVS